MQMVVEVLDLILAVEVEVAVPLEDQLCQVLRVIQDQVPPEVQVDQQGLFLEIEVKEQEELKVENQMIEQMAVLALVELL